MPSRALLIEVRLLDGRYHGAGDWPPSPFRLFQALVAGAYGGRWRHEPDDDKDAAFRWLERLDPPHIAAPAKTEARATTYFVPNNDLDAVGGDPRRISEIRVGKIVRPILFEADAPCLYAWPFDDGEDQARRLCELVERLHTLGRGTDAAFARAQVCGWSEAEDLLARHGGTVARPGTRGGARDPSCPIGGSLDSLKKRYGGGAGRFEQRRDGRTSITLFRQPSKAQFRTLAYDRQPTRLLFDLRSSEDSQRFRAVAQERAADVSKAVRDLTAQRLMDAVVDGQIDESEKKSRSAEIERLIVGRDAGAADIARRVRFIPLPSIGFAHADPSIRRVLVEIPADCPLAEADIERALSGQNVPGFEDFHRSTGEIIDETLLIPAADDGMLRHYGIDRDGGRQHGFRRWHTITPVALPEQRPRGRVGGAARAEADRRAAAAVANALRHAGLDGRGAAIRVQAEPFHRKGARADAFHPDRFAGRLRHVEIVFGDSARGPLIIGDGRWLGLGLMAPAADERLPAVHVFAIDSSQAPPVAAREALVQAMRRAVMARADAEFRSGGARRSEPLPTFFTGHVADGAPARSGHHEHLFFLADDADGDGHIDRLALIAPHMADRTVAYDSTRRSATRDHLRLLDRALAGMTLLRAGRAGAPSLARAPEPGDDDPIFGGARAWVSRTLYRPTRHPRRDAAEAAVAGDLVEECGRRGLPRPDVEIIEVKIGPRGGVLARARLRFQVAVTGPLLLGRGSHVGAGMFGIETQ